MTSSSELTRLCHGVHLSAVDSMPRFAGVSPEHKLSEIACAGYEGVQLGALHSPDLVRIVHSRGLAVSRSGRITMPAQADALARRFADEGVECATLHVGTGLEDDSAALDLLLAVAEASSRHGVPLYPEIHRATLLQDMQRSVHFVERCPSLLLNADFSHWYTGLEMVYGDFDAKLSFLAPVFSRVRYMHGRIGDPGCMQVCIMRNDARSFVQHFKQLWTASFRAFLGSAAPSQRLWFTAELLGPGFFYARTMPDNNQTETCDRWTQSLLLRDIAAECFAHAVDNFQTSQEI